MTLYVKIYVQLPNKKQILSENNHTVMFSFSVEAYTTLSIMNSGVKWGTGIPKRLKNAFQMIENDKIDNSEPNRKVLRLLTSFVYFDSSKNENNGHNTE